MKNTMKTLLSLALAMVLVLGTCSAVFAGGTVTFNGLAEGFSFSPASDYTDTDLFSGMKGVMPGDEITETITFKNAAADCDFVDLYMKAEMLEEEDEDYLKKDKTSAEDMKAFLAKLNLTVKNGSEVIYEGSPDLVDASTGLEEFVLIAKHIASGDTKQLQAVLTVPAELDNSDAGKLGMVKWVFHVEAFNEGMVSVTKVWSDGNDQHAADSVTAVLMQEATDNKTGEVTTKTYDTASLSQRNNWSYVWNDLPEGSGMQLLGAKQPAVSYRYYVEEEAVAGYTYAVRNDGNGGFIITNTKIITPNPGNPGGPSQSSLTVTKEWELAEGQEMPSSVKVVLYRDGDSYRSATLSGSNDWTYEFEGLSDRYSWTVGEADVPEGFTSYVTKSRGGYVITNVSNAKPPLGPNPPAATTVNKSVSKAWDDNNNELGLRPSSVSVTLKKDGAAVESVTLSDANGWSHSWSDLDATSVWTIVEEKVDNYVALYEENGDALTITNMLENQVPLGGAPVDLTVKKVWSGDKASNRPAAAAVTLYNGETPVEAIVLNADNNWTYTWKELDGAGNWKALETSIPKGYTPSYQLKDGVLTITNTASLIQTGQLNWPIAVLGLGGLLLICLGMMITGKKKHS